MQDPEFRYSPRECATLLDRHFKLTVGIAFFSDGLTSIVGFTEGSCCLDMSFPSPTYFYSYMETVIIASLPKNLKP